ncbi:TorD/DmsD family molecular chaperone [Desulfitobacterium hafniense]|nr:molecular chaperone TorD family protein [Desulfitobacterium hafniense]
MRSLDDNEIRERLAYRCVVFDLLRSLFMWECPEELFADMISWSEPGRGEAMAPDCAEARLRKGLSSLSSAELQKVYHEATVEFTRLFVGPYHLEAPPYESVYRNSNRLMMQDVTMNVKRFYRENGYERSGGYKEPDDQIGVELEFMYALSEEALQAFREGNFEGLKRILSAQEHFLDLHLLKWLPQFCQDILKSSQNEFWRSIAVFTENYIEEDKEQIQRVQRELNLYCQI